MLPDLRQLTDDLRASDPCDPDAQGLLKQRIERLRLELKRFQSDDLAPHLEAARLLVGHLASGAAVEPETLVGLACELVQRVERAFAGEQHRGERVLARGRTGVGQGVDSVEALARRIDVSAIEERLLGEVMLQLGFITRAQLEQGLVTQRATDQRIGEALVAIGAATWSQVQEAVEVQALLRSASRPTLRFR